MAENEDYSQWTHEQLQERVKALNLRLTHLEKQVNHDPSTSKLHDFHPREKRRPKNPRSEREFNPDKYSSRLIALKFAYLGQNYNGFEYHLNNTTPLPTIEETLWHAMMKGKLIFPTPNPTITKGEPNWEGCEYSKCGRTDKGVSAFGQVIGIRVRSNRPLSRTPTPLGAHTNGQEEDYDARTHQMELAAPSLKEHETSDELPTPTSSMSLDEETLSFHPIQDEIPYCQVLNRLLPPDIRILAWCPAPPVDFNARFSCEERRYTYYFTQPAFTPTPGPSAPLLGSSSHHHEKRREGYLNITAMDEAAKKFEGLHDFRNFCKLDPSKQIENFQRRIFHAGVSEQPVGSLPAAYTSGLGFQEWEDAESPTSGTNGAAPREPKLCAFTLHGTAFLWHQVRHMVAILFLIGQGLEPPSLIDDLLDVEKTPCKPQYEMASDAPLVLWDCIYPRKGGPLNKSTGRADDAMEWIYVGDDMGQEPGLARGTGKSDGKYGFGGVVDDLWKVWRGRKMDEVLAGTLLNVAAGQGRAETGTGVGDRGTSTRSGSSQKVFQGGDGPKYAGKYVPVLQKPRMEPVEVVNERYRQRKGFEKSEEVKRVGWKRVDLGKGKVGGES